MKYLLFLLTLFYVSSTSAFCNSNVAQKIISEVAVSKTKIHLTGRWKSVIKNNRVFITFETQNEFNNITLNSSFDLRKFIGDRNEPIFKSELKLDAGTIRFTGTLQGNKGFGNFNFSINDEYRSQLRKYPINNIYALDVFSLALLHVSKSYIDYLHTESLYLSSINQIGSLAALNIDRAYFQLWSQDFPNLSYEQLIASALLGIDDTFLRSIKRKDKNYTFNEIIAAKLEFIENQNWKDEGRFTDLNENHPIYIVFKNDTAAFNSLQTIGELNPSPAEALKLFISNINAAYIKGIQSSGYSQVTIDQLIAFNILGIDRSYINSFKFIGYETIPVSTIVALKALNVSKEFHADFSSIGYTDIPINILVVLKLKEITPSYIKQFRTIGFNNFSLSDALVTKSFGLTPQFVTEMQQKGYLLSNVQHYIRLKAP